MDTNRRRTVESFDSLRRQVEAMGLFQRSRLRVFGELAFVVILYAVAVTLIGTVTSYVLATIAAITLVWWIHDAGHSAFFSKKETSNAFIETFGVIFLGMPQIEYHFEVHRIHHAHTNIIGRDGALETGPVKWHHKQLSERHPKFLRYQALIWFFVALPLVWPLITSRCVKTMWKRGHFVRLSLLVLRWGLALAVFREHFGFVFLPPLIAGFVMGFVSSLNHFHRPIDDQKQDLFPMSVFITTQNLKEHGFLATWVTGGLNFHIEHHLFPTMPSKNLRHVKPLVEKFAREKRFVLQRMLIARGDCETQQQIESSNGGVVNLFRYREDAWPVAIVWSGVFLSMTPFFIDSPAAWLLAATGLLCRVLAPIHQHNHAHLSTFVQEPANAIHDAVLSVAAGSLTADWRVHHGLGHHVDYLDPKNDFEGNFRFGNIRCRRLVFAVVGSSVTLIDSMKILARFPKKVRKTHQLAIVRQLAIQISLFTLLALLSWKLTLAMFIVPGFLLRAGVFWFSFGQHDDVPMTNVYDSSTTKSKFGARLLNVEHHTAHHERPGLHWSKLPKRTEEIRPLIHEKCVR